MTALLWYRRDLRLRDHPALLAALASGPDVLPVFVIDPPLVRTGAARTARLYASLAALHESTDGALVVRTGDPAKIIPALAAEVGAGEVHVTRETTPYGRRRDRRVAAHLAESGCRFAPTGTPYAVGPGLVLTGAGTAYQVFTPYEQAWREHGWPAPAGDPTEVGWRHGVDGEALPEPGDTHGLHGFAAGEDAASTRWHAFLDEDLTGYATERDRPDLDTTSRMSIHLKYGEIHPRTMLADLATHHAAHPAATSEDARRYVTELCWREFYADVLWHRPESAWQDLRGELSSMPYDGGPHDAPEHDELAEAWRAGRTGFPMVDAGMRQLLAEGWMHNRLRMLTASFFVKDLHRWWPEGARHFLTHLLDGDIASNNHGWQWVAGTGASASPYFRVFNPMTQATRFDPDGDYVRRWVPELAHLPGPAVHEPWRHPEGYARGYPPRIVDHADERRESLGRYHRARGGRR
ncbi:MAG: DNA photolyase family protein [Micrococcales bacterium]|nr:DNA photolyase family protein [Micrococcales bacterium]